MTQVWGGLRVFSCEIAGKLITRASAIGVNCWHAKLLAWGTRGSFISSMRVRPPLRNLVNGDFLRLDREVNALPRSHPKLGRGLGGDVGGQAGCAVGLLVGTHAKG